MFGGGIILCLSYLNRKFGREENIVQVTAVLGMVYLNYFVADLVCATSGVIATVAAGLTVKLFGRGSINNISLMDDFFSITEHILNTILFTLGGLVWGAEIVRNHNSLLWSGTDWGYLILLYVLLHVIRACLFVSVYPITSRIGLSTTWPETLFQIYGGLRGAVGLALAIALENETSVRTDDVYPLTDQNNWVSQVYQMVGGVALLTLVINGSTAGPVLIWLGLADSSEAREKIIKSYRVLLRAEMIESLVELLTHERFKHIDFAFVNKQIPLMSDLDLAQLAEFVEHLKDITPSDKYCPPYLGNIVSHLKLKDGVTDEEMELRSFDILREDPIAHARKMRIEKRKRGRQSTTRSSMVAMMADNPLSTKELRLLFISMLRAQYEKQLDEGLLTSQHGMTVALQQSLEEAEVHVSNGGQLNDLHYLQKFHNFSLKLNKYFTKASCGSFRRSKKNSVDDMILKGWVLQEMAFTTAHERAQEFFQEQLGESDKELSEAGKIVVAESKRQMKEVADDLNRHVVGEFVIRVSTHKCCEILLTKGIKYIESLSNNGLLKDSETEEMVEEMVHLLNETKEAAVDVEGKKDILLDLNQYLSSRDLNLDGHGKKDIARDLNLSTIGEAEDKNPVMNVDKGEDEEGPVMNVEEA
ncbi:MAG: NhaP-type Na+/H+ or K+/H+ antiporter [Bacillariaceae sp.]|jgi:NhaP-type Na+/H+ or K+/H+ antiporter